MNLHDLLAVGAPPERLRSAAFKVIDRTQDDPAVQLRAVAVALVCLCRATDTDIRQLMESTERLVDALDSPFTGTIRGMMEYAKHEIGRRKY